MNSYDYAQALMEIEQVYWIAGEPWEVRSGMLSPVGPPHKSPKVDMPAIRQAILQSNSYGARWTYRWDGPPSEWWWIICDDQQYDVTRLSKRMRKDIRRGLRRCAVRRVETRWLAENGYQVYEDAHKRYDGFQPSSVEDFQRSLLARSSLKDFHCWGAFVEDRLVSYVTCIILNDCALTLTEKSDPDALRFKPNNALSYEINRHYLREAGLQYVASGSRNVHHATSIQDFLLRMGNRRAYARLGLVFRRDIELALRARMGKVGKLCESLKIMPDAARKVVALDQLWEIACST